MTSRLMRFASGLHHRFWWLRAVTLGVRVIVLDGEQVFLVRHTYLPGWYLPGGAVDRGESAEAAALRELREEGGIVALERPTLLGFYRNGRRDHVACYVLRHASREAGGDGTPEGGARMPDWEIAEVGFFPIRALPAGTTTATRARLAELLDGQPLDRDW